MVLSPSKLTISCFISRLALIGDAKASLAEVVLSSPKVNPSFVFWGRFNFSSIWMKLSSPFFEKLKLTWNLFSFASRVIRSGAEPVDFVFKDIKKTRRKMTLAPRNIFALPAGSLGLRSIFNIALEDVCDLVGIYRIFFRSFFEDSHLLPRSYS